MSIYDPISIALGIEPIELHLYNTLLEDAIKTKYGDNTGEKIPGIGGAPKGRVPWNKGLTSADPRVKKNADNMSASKRATGFYDTCSKYLPVLTGDNNHMRTPEHRARMSALAKTRDRLYTDNGTWSWGYIS